MLSRSRCCLAVRITRVIVQAQLQLSSSVESVIFSHTEYLFEICTLVDVVNDRHIPAWANEY